MMDNEYTHISELTSIVKKRVYILLIVYFFILILAVLLSVVLTVYGLYMFFQEVKNGLGFEQMKGLFAVGAAGYCIAAMCRPLIGIFRQPEECGIVINRDGYPELYALIDQAVTAANCQFPKQIRVSDECNAYVYHKSLIGYLFSGKQYLTIGVPLLSGMNKTELLSVLSHEFGHFNQKSLKTNRIANLSEYICVSIKRTQQKLKENNSYPARWANWFVSNASSILMRQYRKLAPYNSALSRAQEYDADHLSQMIAGTEGSISALCKLDYNSDIWNAFISEPPKKGQRNFYNSIYEYNSAFYKEYCLAYNIHLDPSDHLKQQRERFSSRIDFSVSNDTHPSIEDRINALKSYPIKDTLWDDTAALSLFEIKNLIKSDLASQDSSDDIEFSPPYFESFKPIQHSVIQETIINLEEFSSNTPIQSFPFTLANALIIGEFDIASRDYQTLKALYSENSPSRSFSYCGEIYNGDNVPLKQHENYMQSIEPQAREIADQCVSWLIYQVKKQGNDATFLLWLYFVSIQASLHLHMYADVVENIKKSEALHIPIAKIKNGEDFLNFFKDVAKPYIEVVSPDGTCAFEFMAKKVGIYDYRIKEVLSFFNEEKPNTKSFPNAYLLFLNVIDLFSEISWNWVKHQLILES